MKDMLNPNGVQALVKRLLDARSLAREHAPAPGQEGSLTPGHLRFFKVIAASLEAFRTEPTNDYGDTINARVYDVERFLAHAAGNLAHLTREDELATRLYQLIVEAHQIAYKLMTEAHNG